jgi:hypothetical protein
MKVGDLVRLKKEHYLSEIFDTNCQIHEVKKFQIRINKESRYHIRTISGELKWVWVNESELDRISEIRNDKLKELGIN